MTKRLSQVETKEVSLVDVGAVQKKFALLKRDGSMDEKILKAALEYPLDNEAEVDAALEKAGISPEAGKAVKASMRLMAAHSDLLTEEQKTEFAKAMDKKAPVDPEDQADGGQDEDEEDGDPAASDKPTKTKKAASAAAGETIVKTEIAPEVQAQFEAITKANTELLAKQEKLEKANAELLEKAESKECLEKAAKEFPLVGATAEVGAFIHSLKKAGLWDEKAERILKGAQEKANAAELFSVKGSSATGGNAGDKSAEEALNKAARAIAEAKKIPFAKAYGEAMDAHPELYKAYEAEKAAR